MAKIYLKLFLPEWLRKKNKKQKSTSNLFIKPTASSLNSVKMQILQLIGWDKDIAGSIMLIYILDIEWFSYFNCVTNMRFLIWKYIWHGLTATLTV